MAGTAFAQARDKDPVSVTVTASPATVRRGVPFRLEVRFDIAAPYHIYGPKEAQGAPTKVEPEGAAGLSFGPPAFPPPEEKNLPALGGTFALYEKQAVVSIPATVAADAAPGAREVRVKVSYGACTDTLCLRPVRDKAVAAQVAISDAPPVTAVPAAGAGSPPANPLQDKSLLAFLALCVGGGLLSLIQPCVYPIVPITMTYFIKQSGDSRRRSLGLAALYALGVIVTFTGLGMILSATFGARAAIAFAASPWVNLVIALLFLAFALSMFGVFDIRLPGSWTHAIASGPRGGFGGAFVLGLSFSVITFTCTMPIASSLLVLAAGGTQGLAAAGMLAYSATMALPFFVLGLSPVLLKRIPRSGGWLVTAKVAMGFFELALVVYYAAKVDYGRGWGVLTRAPMLALWLALGVCTAATLFGWLRLRGHEGPEAVGWGRRLIALAVVGLCGVLVAGLAGHNLGFLDSAFPEERPKPGPTNVSEIPKPSTEGWLDDLDQGLREARRPLFVEFTAFT